MTPSRSNPHAACTTATEHRVITRRGTIPRMLAGLVVVVLVAGLQQQQQNAIGQHGCRRIHGVCGHVGREDLRATRTGAR